MNNNNPETSEQKEARRQTYIAFHNVCAAAHCDYPEPDAQGWCINCNYPVTAETQDSWKGFQSGDSRHRDLLKKLAEWKEDSQEPHN